MGRLALLGVGSALPSRVVTNAELERLTGFSASRILEMFEIEERRWARGPEQPDPPAGERCSDLALRAAREALAAAGLEAHQLGALIAVTTTPDSLNPPLDSQVAQGLGALGLTSFSLQTPCTGLFRATEIASALLASVSDRPILVVAAETPSPFFRFGSDVPTEHVLNSVLYADGAGALIVGREDGEHPVIERIDLLLNADAAAPGITFPAMLSAMPPTLERFEKTDYLGHHDFRRVLRRGGKLAAGAALRMMESLEVGAADVRYFVTHQATGNIRRIGASFGLPPEKFPVNIGRVGNTVSASVPILLDELVRGGSLAKGDLLILHTAESSTWSSAAMAIRW
jgi:3-oxoacyl-(acyl-carrier-protein) synthase III